VDTPPKDADAAKSSLDLDAQPSDKSASWDLDPMIGTLVGGRYRVKAMIGRGGMGVVYDAVHEQLGRSAAIKVVSKNFADDPRVIERFMREARTIAQIGHPNIVDVYDLGRLDDDRPYLVMERLFGVSLYDLLRQQGRQEVSRVAELLEGVAAGLEVVHAKGIVHRDVKLENMMLARTEDGGQIVKLLDFGIAAIMNPGPDSPRITANNMITGTPLYLAPETAAGQQVDHRADIYSFAVVAFMLLTGAAPFDSASPIIVITRKMSQKAPRLSEVAEGPFSEDLEEVIARGLATYPDDRYQSAKAFVQDLRALSISASLTFAVRDVGRKADPPPKAPPPPTLEIAPTNLGSPIFTPTELKLARLPREKEARPRRWPLRGGIAVGAVALAAIAVAQLSKDRSEAPQPSSIEKPIPAPERPPPPIAPAATEKPAMEQSRPETKAIAAVAAPKGRPARSRLTPPPPQPPPPVAKPSPVIAADDAPQVTTPAADLARAESATRAGMKSLYQGLLPDAINAFREATNAAPSYAPAWRGLGLANEKLARTSEALAAYRRYLKLSRTEKPDVVQEIEKRVAMLERP
jgi:serine/threonine-protein kinase